MKKQIILDELNELLNIPQLERILFHKLKELKVFFAEEISRYRELREKFRKDAYGDLGILTPDTGPEKKNHAYYFELFLHPDESWHAESIAPAPPAGYDIYDIIPETVVEYIGKFKPTPGKIEHLEALSFPEIKKKTFELKFTHYSQWHILGTIMPRPAPPAAGEEEEMPDHIVDIYNYHQKDSDEANYKELFYYMQRFPVLRRYFFTELHMKVKPLIVGKLVDITSSSRPVGLF